MNSFKDNECDDIDFIQINNKYLNIVNYCIDSNNRIFS